MPTIRCAPTGRMSRPCRNWAGERTVCGSRLPAAISAKGASPRRGRRWSASRQLDVSREIEIPEAERARAAAYVITATEGAALHLDRLRKRAKDFDPAVRDRLIAGAMVPATLVNRAQKFRRWYRERVLELFREVDVILAPATPCTAPAIGQQTFVLDGVEMPLRPNIGLYTQPISFIGLPVVAVPVPLKSAADCGADHRGALAGGCSVSSGRRAGAIRRRGRTAAKPLSGAGPNLGNTISGQWK